MKPTHILKKDCVVCRNQYEAGTVAWVGMMGVMLMTDSDSSPKPVYGRGFFHPLEDYFVKLPESVLRMIYE